MRALGAEQQTRGQRTGIIADESSSTVSFNTEVPQWISQPDTAQYVDRLAHHTYNNPGDDQRAKIYETSKSVGKQSWSTEICCFGNGGTGWAQEYDPTIDGGLNLSRIVYKDFATAHDSAFQWWVALSEQIGSDPLAKNSEGWNDGLIYYDPNYATNGNADPVLHQALLRARAVQQVRAAGRGRAQRDRRTGRRRGVDVRRTTASGSSWSTTTTPPTPR